jgi:hypothetical protein
MPEPEDPQRRRLLLYQVLLEEYKSLGKFPHLGKILESKRALSPEEFLPYQVLQADFDLAEPPPAEAQATDDAATRTQRQQQRDALFNQLKNTYRDPDERVREKAANADLVAAFFVLMNDATLADSRASLSALCLSGGGIRSATFNLGILQGLARHGLLSEFDYLSTVSGGGFIGGWLSAWIKRRTARKVFDGLSKMPDNPLEPDPKPVEHLRSYSNYLAPKVGLLNADTWTLVAIYFRNLLLNWIVLIPLLLAVLMIPRISLAVLLSNPEAFVPWSLFGGIVAAALALVYIGTSLPSARRPDSQGHRNLRFYLLCLLPLVLSSIALTDYWAWHQNNVFGGGGEKGFFSFVFNWSIWAHFIIFAFATNILGWIVYAIYRFSNNRIAQYEGAWMIALFVLLFSLPLIGVANLVTGSLTWLAANCFLSPNCLGTIAPPHFHPRLYVCFAVPVLLTIYNLGGTLIAGLTSRWTDDEDQEWWARCGAWVMIAILGWGIFSVLVLYGPSLLLTLPAQLSASGREFWMGMFKSAGVVVGIVSGIIALFGGHSAKSSGNSGAGARAVTNGSSLDSLIGISATIFFGLLLIFLALITNWLLSYFSYAMSALAASGAKLADSTHVLSALAGHVLKFAALLTNDVAPAAHREFLANSHFWFLIVATLLLWVTGGVMGWCINSNRFSYHYYWRNRIIRAYLGASHTDRKPNIFTGFDKHDNIPMHELRQKPLHIINIALNLVGGDNLAWQERMAESFTVSPLHSGNRSLGYRRSKLYGGPKYLDRQGISLGTAVAISGAAASPNMGYMMPSGVTRFLMTLFNIRLGCWLGNPGAAGETTFDRDSPRLSVLPITKEAFGMTNDRAAYVYLSDGGHFDNLGLYEMILRRNRLIVVSDASTDNAYKFEDLGMAIRKIRIDLGIPIDFDTFDIKGQNLGHNYCAIGKIRYSCVDGAGSTDGTLIYIKPTLIGQEPRDVHTYWETGTGFPQESIIDQFFTESQFESYRALGSHMIDALCGGDDRDPPNLAALRATIEQQANSVVSPAPKQSEIVKMEKAPEQ